MDMTGQPRTLGIHHQYLQIASLRADDRLSEKESDSWVPLATGIVLHLAQWVASMLQPSLQATSDKHFEPAYFGLQKCQVLFSKIKTVRFQKATTTESKDLDNFFKNHFRFAASNRRLRSVQERKRRTAKCIFDWRDNHFNRSSWSSTSHFARIKISNNQIFDSV